MFSVLSRLFGHTGACSACGQSIPASEMVMRAQGNVYHLKVGYVKHNYDSIVKVHPKIKKILTVMSFQTCITKSSLLTFVSFQTCMTDFLLETQKDVLKNVFVHTIKINPK